VGIAVIGSIVAEVARIVGASGDWASSCDDERDTRNTAMPNVITVQTTQATESACRVLVNGSDADVTIADCGSYPFD
jgi:hypothetical protein